MNRSAEPRCFPSTADCGLCRPVGRFLAYVLTMLLLGAPAAARAQALALDPARQMLSLAHSRFETVTQEDWNLFQTVTSAAAATVPLEPHDAEDAEPVTSTVRAEVIMWVCTDSEAARLVTHRGIVLSGIRVLGRLDLRFAKIGFPIIIADCELPDGMDLQDASLPELHIARTRLGSFVAAELMVEHDLLLREVQATSEVNLKGAEIGGNLDCDGSDFCCEGCITLNAAEVIVSGDVLLRYGFHSLGEVNLQGARVGGDLQCDEALLESSGPDCLFADGIQVGGDVFLRYAFQSSGRVSLVGAKITGDLDCEYGAFANPDEAAVAARRIDVQGEVRLSDATVEGDLVFSDARIEGNFDCQNSQFEGTVNLNGTRIDGAFRWRTLVAVDSTRLDLRAATVNRLIDDAESWPPAGNLFLHGLTYETIDTSAPSDAASRIDWLRRQPQDESSFRPQPYEHLAGVLRRIGNDADAEEVLIAKEADGEQRMGWSERLLHQILGISIGYGYRPWRALWIGVMMIVIGAAIFSVGARAGLIAATKEVEHVFEGREEHRLSKDYPRFNALVYSLDMFVPLLDLHQANYWLPSSSRGAPIINSRWYTLSAGGVLRFYLGFHIYLGWTLTTLLAVGLSGLVVQ